MYRTQSSVPALAIVAALALGACQERAPTEASSRLLAASAVSLESNGRYVVVFSAERVPVDFGERVAALGGSIESAIDSIGVAGVTGLSEVAATELGAAADIRAVEPDPMTRPRDDGEAVDGLADEAASEAAVASRCHRVPDRGAILRTAVEPASGVRPRGVGRRLPGFPRCRGRDPRQRH